VTAATFTYETTEELLEVVFSGRSVPRLCNEDQLPSPVSCEPVMGDSLETAVGEFSQGSQQVEVGVRTSQAC
jgi:hypothetical protein